MIPSGENAAAAGARRAAEFGLPTLTLDEDGVIRDCSLSGEKLFGYRSRELVWQHVSKLFPQLSEVELVKNSRLNPRLGFLCHCGHSFQSRNRDGSVFLSELSFVHLGGRRGDEGRWVLRLIVRPTGSDAAHAVPL